jgi:hypothetical protein
MPLQDILKIKLKLQRFYHISTFDIDRIGFWELEEYLKIVEQFAKEEKKQEEEQQKSTNMPNYDTGGMMRNANNMMSKLPKYK